VQFISLSSRNSEGRPSKDSAVRFASSKHGPDDPCILVGDRHRGSVEAAPLSKLVDPLIGVIGLVWRCPDNGAGAVDEQRSQVLVATLRDAHQNLAIATRELPGHKPDPGSEMAAILELGAIADRGDDRRGGLGTDALDLGDALAGRTIAEDAIDLLIEHTNAAVEIVEEIVELVDGFTSQGREVVLEVGQDAGMERRARVMLLAMAKPRSSRSPRIWLTTAVR
jgi:hypothetical protein